MFRIFLCVYLSFNWSLSSSKRAKKQEKHEMTRRQRIFFGFFRFPLTNSPIKDFFIRATIKLMECSIVMKRAQKIKPMKCCCLRFHSSIQSTWNIFPFSRSNDDEKSTIIIGIVSQWMRSTCREKVPIIKSINRFSPCPSRNVLFEYHVRAYDGHTDEIKHEIISFVISKSPRQYILPARKRERRNMHSEIM